MSLPWLKRSSVLPPCPLGIAKSHLAYKTLCLALFLTFHHSFIPQTFMEHLCVPGSALGAEGDGGEWSLSSRCLRLLPWISQPCWDGFLTLMCSILSYLVPWPLCIGFSAFPSLSPTSELLFVFFFKTQVWSLPPWRFPYLCWQSFNSALLEEKKKMSSLEDCGVEEQRPSCSRESK